ncbi:MAG: DUF4352 domain-containing protein [Chloroflexota bacterium]|nr:DUF4352 domain-containing protein [Chloroflexota bacterium]
MQPSGRGVRQAACSMLLWCGLVALGQSACAARQPFVLQAAGPFPYQAMVGPAFERVAILVTVANESGDDLQVNPTDFLARDSEHRVYPANPAATIADFPVAGRTANLRGIIPLPTMTLRARDVLTGYVVFDVPAGAWPVELVWRQSDIDSVAVLRPNR